MSYAVGLKGDRRTLFERKYERGRPDECWIWFGAKGRYGSFLYMGRPREAHRVSWMLYRGEIPDGMRVCHTCDNTLCVNPDHLFLGTAKDNTQDMIRKGRHRYGTWNAPRGDNHWTRKTHDSVR